MPTFTVGADLGAPAQKIWDTLKDSSVIIPKIAPQAVASIEHVDGPKEGPGSVRLTKLGPVAPAGSFVKEKLVSLDQATFTAVTEEIEGGHLAQGFSKWVSTIKFTPVSDSVTKWETSIDYEGGSEIAIERTKEKLPKMIGGLVDYINKQ